MLFRGILGNGIDIKHLEDSSLLKKFIYISGTEETPRSRKVGVWGGGWNGRKNENGELQRKLISLLMCMH
jgi:hypothetical protein